MEPQTNIESCLQKLYMKFLTCSFRNELKAMSGKCMDIGCGLGTLTLQLLLPVLHPSATVIGTDINETMIEFAKKNYCESDRLNFEVMDMGTTDLHEKYINAFDHIFVFHGLNACSNIEQAFRNIHRMLRLGGTILLCYRIESDFNDIFKALANDERFASYNVNGNELYKYNKTFILKTEARKFLEKIGFDIYKYRYLKEWCSAEWLEYKLSEFIDSHVSSLITNLPHTLREDFKEQLRKEGMKASIDPPDSQDTLRRNIIQGDCVYMFAKKCKEHVVK